MKYLNIIPFLLLCGYSILFMIDEWNGYWIFLFSIWLFIACVIWALFALVNALSKNRGNIKYRRTIVASQAVVIAMFTLCFIINECYKLSNVDDIRRNFDKHETEIESLAKSMDGFLYPNTDITIEFTYGKESLFHVTDSLNQQHMNWNEDAVANRDSLMRLAGLDELEFKYIKDALKSSRCIGIKTSLPDYCDVWCTRVGMGMYCYRIYLRPLSEKEQTHYLTEDDHSIPYNDHVLFMFDSSIGKDTFTKEEKEHYLNEFQCVDYGNDDLWKRIMNYDLSETVINPTRIATDHISSWWSDDFITEWKEHGNEMEEDVWCYRGPTLGYKGESYSRFDIHFSNVTKASGRRYNVKGLIRCEGVISQFSGFITLASVEELTGDTEYSFLRPPYHVGVVTAHYEFEVPDLKAKMSGKSTYNVLEINDSIYYDALFCVADGFCNNQYEGIWLDLTSQKSVKCNWGDCRIPDSDNLDVGVGEFCVDKKYINNGWQLLDGNHWEEYQKDCQWWQNL